MSSSPLPAAPFLFDKSGLLPTHMQAALFYAPRDVRLQTVPLPKPAAGEVLVKLHTALTCGTDLKCYRRDHPVLLGSKRPAPFGHEGAGLIAAVGQGVTQSQPGFYVGQAVAFANSAPCGTCFFCQKQQPNLCEQLLLLNGTYAEAIMLPPRIVAQNTYAFEPNNGLSFEHAAFTEPLAVSLRGVKACGLSPGDHLAIMGLGSIGQLMVKVAVLQGLHVTAFGRSPAKLEMAQRFGEAHAVVSMKDGLNPEAIKHNHTPEGRGFDAVIEAVGLPETWELAVQLARRGGLVNWFAGCAGGSTITLPTQRIHYDELTLVSPFHHTPVEVKEAFDLLNSGRINPAPLISGHLPLAQIEEALQAMEQGQGFKYAIYS